jgi:hypothetical protein
MNNTMGNDVMGVFDNNILLVNLFYIIAWNKQDEPHEKIIKWIKNILGKKEITISDECCAICLDKIEKNNYIVNNSCCHTFHKDCYYKWISLSASCPICRANPFHPSDILKY